MQTKVEVLWHHVLHWYYTTKAEVLSQMYHSQAEEWLVLWVYGGGQKTKHNQFWYRVMVKFILGPNNVNEELCN